MGLQQQVLMLCVWFSALCDDYQDLKVMVLQSLGTCRNPEIVQRALDFALSDAVRFQDAVYVIGSAAANPSGRRLARKFLEEKCVSAAVCN